MPEVVALEQERQVQALRKGTDEAVAVIQLGGMVSLAEATVGVGGDQGFRQGDHLDDHAELEEYVHQELAVVVAGSIVEHDQRLGHASGRHPWLIGGADQVAEQRPLRLVEKDGDDGRRIDDHHLGKPHSS